MFNKPLDLIKDKKQFEKLKLVLYILAVIAQFLLGAAAVGWGLAHLVKVSQVPACMQPLKPGFSDLEVEAVKQTGDAEIDQLGFLQVEVSGAVVNPGVYRLKRGQRMGEALIAAGGLSWDVDEQYINQRINLAEKVKDEGKIYIPFAVEAEIKDLRQIICQKEKVEKKEPAAEQQNECISINRAESDDLQSLPGIGEKRAAEIIQNRPFSSIDDLLTKKVIGESLFKDIQKSICL